MSQRLGWPWYSECEWNRSHLSHRRFEKLVDADITALVNIDNPKTGRKWKLPVTGKAV